MHIFTRSLTISKYNFIHWEFYGRQNTRQEKKSIDQVKKKKKQTNNNNEQTTVKSKEPYSNE